MLGKLGLPEILVIAAIANLFATDERTYRLVIVVAGVLYVLAPFSIIRHLAQRHTIDQETMLGAISAYLAQVDAGGARAEGPSFPQALGDLFIAPRHGVVVVGTTGESPTLLRAEEHRLFREIKAEIVERDGRRIAYGIPVQS